MNQTVEVRPGDGSAPGEANSGTGREAESAHKVPTGEASDSLNMAEIAHGRLYRVTGALNVLRRLTESTDSSRIDVTGADLWGMLDLIGEEAELAHGNLRIVIAGLLKRPGQSKEMRHGA
jgi:hypothetical protein